MRLCTVGVSSLAALARRYSPMGSRASRAARQLRHDHRRHVDDAADRPQQHDDEQPEVWLIGPDHMDAEPDHDQQGEETASKKHPSSPRAYALAYLTRGLAPVNRRCHPAAWRAGRASARAPGAAP